MTDNSAPQSASLSVAAAMTELMQRNASPADRAIQAGIDECMRGVIRQQTSQDPEHAEVPDRAGSGHRPTGRAPARVWRPVSGIDVACGAGLGRSLVRSALPIEPGSVAEKVQNALIDQACGPLKPKAAGDEKA